MTSTLRIATIAALAAGLAAAGPIAGALGESHAVSGVDLTIRSGPEENDLRVTYDATTARYTITDQAGIDGNGFTEIDAQTVSCRPDEFASIALDPDQGNDRALFAASIPAGPGRVFVDAVGGNDVIEFERGSRVATDLRAASGHDTIIGSGAHDYMLGEGGNDRLLGRGGNDQLNGDTGKDRLVAGTSDDAINAQAGDRDAIIDCGPGDDAVRLDRKDPKPKRCEHIRR
jgi:Ca2+-binding RTX toxin-like protein